MIQTCASCGWCEPVSVPPRPACVHPDTLRASSIGFLPVDTSKPPPERCPLPRTQPSQPGEVWCECGDGINADERCERDHLGKWHCVRCIEMRPETGEVWTRERVIEIAQKAHDAYSGHIATWPSQPFRVYLSTLLDAETKGTRGRTS